MLTEVVNWLIIMIVQKYKNNATVTSIALKKTLIFKISSFFVHYVVSIL